MFIGFYGNTIIIVVIIITFMTTIKFIQLTDFVLKKWGL
jgi:hypothetical protein